MTQPNTPPVNAVPVSRDARNRAWRTLLQGLGIDVATAVVLVLATAFDKIEWTQTYWYALGLVLARTVLQSIVAYFVRKLVNPVGATGAGDVKRS